MLNYNKKYIVKNTIDLGTDGNFEVASFEILDAGTVRYYGDFNKTTLNSLFDNSKESTITANVNQEILTQCMQNNDVNGISNIGWSDWKI